MKHDLEPNNIHDRYQTQAGWTAAIRSQWFERLALQPDHRVLEVGSGTGVIISDIGLMHDCQTFGLDIDPRAAQFAHMVDPNTRYTIADAADLPYPAATFDAAICHFLLMWLESPQRVLAEMKRVTQPGGWVLALAEPDYGGRIDYPPEISVLGQHQEDSLRQQGCDTQIGRKLRALLHQLDLEDIRVGVLGGDWEENTMEEMQDSEWQMLTHDLKDTVSPNELHQLHQLDQNAWIEGSRILFVPTFYGGGRVQSE
jgi:ubiquinone/menaquinone biosynthesis C-methylase UbiE